MLKSLTFTTDVATREDVLSCFRLLLDREPNAEEIPGHFSMVGAPLHVVVTSYLQSLEFRNRGLLVPAIEAEIVQVNGVSIYVAKDDLLIAPGIRSGEYAPEVTSAFLEHMGRGAVVDIGANCGHFALLAASHSRRVYAFEPLQANLRLLHASAILNGFEGLTIIGAAASDVPRTLTIGASYTNGIVQEARSRPHSALSADYVAAVRVDDVIDEPVSIIKIDVEGHEYRAIAGAIKTIKRDHPAIISEFSPAGLEANSGKTGAEYLELLSGLGYNLSVIGKPEANTAKAILASCRGTDHVDILAIARGSRR